MQTDIYGGFHQLSLSVVLWRAGMGVVGASAYALSEWWRRTSRVQGAKDRLESLNNGSASGVYL